ncbi:hypothetical protein KUV64_01680 [Mameliella alba]|uniref:RipA family octameric membrane protein n=1 Tax=Mameliella alba TaxID=561184 RepID=UPI001C959C98|nr:hypothetical protein [Mameliella alba]MBY6117831.1 hypothetical protein [Mameliella alba]
MTEEMDSFRKSVKLEVYKVAFSKLNQIEDAVWRRFNFLSVIQSAVLGTYFLALRDLPDDFGNALIKIALAAFGALVSFVSLRTVMRLMSWHAHYVRQCQVIEEDLSNFGAVRILPFTEGVIAPSRWATGAVPMLWALFGLSGLTLIHSIISIAFP